MKSLRLLPLLLIVLALGLPAPSHAGSDAPYIYYYSDLLQGWVIERADGTDSRVIGQGLQQADYYFEDVNWSPSGNWMAWRSAEWCGPCARGYQGWAMRTDGSKVLSQLSRNNLRVNLLEWSPTDDLLFASWVEINQPRIVTTVLAIIDPENNTVIAETTLEYSQMEYFSDNYGWLQDGSGIYAVTYADSDATAVTILYKDGRVSTRILDSFYPNFVEVTGGFSYNLRIRSNGRIPVIEDLTTRQILETAEYSLQVRAAYDLYWNPVLSTALQEIRTCSKSECYYPDVTIMFELVAWLTGQRIQLPENLRLSRLYGNEQFFASSWDQNLFNQLWSPDGNRLMLVGDQQPGQFYLVEASTGTVTQLPYFDDLITWQWASSNALLVQRRVEQPARTGFPTYYYDLETFEAHYIGQYQYFELSPSGRYFGLDAAYFGQYAAVVSLETMQTMNLIPHGNPCAREIDYLWNKPETWLLAGYPAVCAGGGGDGHGGVSVYSMDGQIQRELTVCSVLGQCAGFLPEHAIPHLSEAQTESVLLQPEAILNHSEDGVAVVGWSPEGHTLVTTAKEDASLVYFWDMTSTPRLIGTQETQVDCLVCEGTWTPDGRYLSLFGLTIGEVWDSQNARLVQRLLIAPPRPYWQEMGYGVATTQCRRLLPGQIEGSILTTQIQGQQFQVDLNYALCSRNGEWMLAESNGQLLALQPDLVNTLPVGDDRPEGQIITDYLPNSPVLIATTPRSIYGKTHMSLLDRELGQWLTVPINFFTSNAALSPDGRWIAAAGAQTATIWDIAKIRARQVVE